MTTILCVEDEPAVGVVLEHALRALGHDVILASNGAEALRVVARTPVDLILSDFQMPGMTGLELLQQLVGQGYQIPFVVITGHGSIEHAVLSIRSGAIDYLTKPLEHEALEITVTNALEVGRLRQENRTFRDEISRLTSRRKIVGGSAAVRRVMEVIATAAPSRATVLLEGESGTGKELFARAIHEQSPRRDKPFITINCAAMPEGLVESVLFGHEKGAFTGASARTPGAFERANGGTLLLDEISEMRLDLQSKLLRVIQEQEFERVGGSQAIRVDVRLVATTNRDLWTEVQAGRFRSDLYYRLQVVPIRTPPLRERPEDIPLLVQAFAKSAAEALGVPTPAVLPETAAYLQGYEWPGNVRELANAVERAIILANGKPLWPELFQPYLSRGRTAPPATPGAVPTPPLGAAPAAPAAPTSELPLDLAALERIAIDRALAATAGNRTKAARLLGISERTLRNKLNTPGAQAG